MWGHEGHCRFSINLTTHFLKCFCTHSFLNLQTVEKPHIVIEENGSMRRAPAPKRVEDMFEQVKSKLPGAPKFLLCILAERKNSDVYGWF